MKYAWIAKHKTRWPVTLSCEVLEVSASAYFEHASASGGPRLATSASFLPLEGSSTSKRLLHATHWPLIRASVLSRLGSLRRERGGGVGVHWIGAFGRNQLLQGPVVSRRIS